MVDAFVTVSCNRFDMLRQNLPTWEALSPEATLVVASWQPDDDFASVWPGPYVVVPMDGPFSLGRGRNAALRRCPEDWFVAVLDADMILPPNEPPAMPQHGEAFFPLYRLQQENPELPYQTGRGWGNVMGYTETLQKAAWPEFTKWGPEDQIYAKQLRAAGVKHIRADWPGLTHRWHPKVGQWYTGDTAPKLFLPPSYNRRLKEAHYDDTPNTDAHQAEVYRLGQLFNPASVLDIGCGSAYKLRLNFPLAKRTGTDVPKTVDWLNGKYPGEDWQVADYSHDLGQKYDLIILADVLEHLLDPALVLQWAARQLSASGILLASTPARELLPPGYSKTGPPRNPSHMQEWSSAEFAQFCGQAVAVQFTGVTAPHTTVVVGRALTT